MTEESEVDDTLTALDVTIDKIGMGYYQWSLLGLCGFGWLADNMWMEGIAIALPRIQDHYGISSQRMGWPMTFMFCGMMLGAIGWGNCSDVLGRKIAFNNTLLLSAIFGVLVSFSPSFFFLCCSLLLLGTAVGGSIPTDGTLFLENLPRRKRYLLTFLSVFFSVGAVVAALVGVAIVPSHSCPEAPAGSLESPPCDVATQNQGWKYLFMLLTLITTVMFICRIFFFNLYESPRYLVHAGRAQDAVYVLKQITKVNGGFVDVQIEDVDDSVVVTPTRAEGSPNDNTPDYLATNVNTYRLDSAMASVNTGAGAIVLPPTPLPATAHSHLDLKPTTFFHLLPSRIRKPIMAWWELTSRLMMPQWRRTTLLMWAAWVSTSAAYTLFNLFFPKLVELRLGKQKGGSRSAVLWNVVVYTLGGTPGALIGAWMIETRLGRRKSLALSTALTGGLCLLFNLVPSNAGVLITSMGISFTTTIMWAVLYGMTPEMFVTEVRGTACGNASALNRVAGIIAPLIGGFLIDIDVSYPTYAAALAFFVGAGCALALPFESAFELEAASGRDTRSDGQTTWVV